MRSAVLARWAATAVAAASVLVLVPVLPERAFAQRTADVLPAQIDGQINGQKARFLSKGDDVLISATEADRLGLPYRDGKTISIGGTPLWIVVLPTVTVDGQTRLVVQAGVVPSIAGYFAALRAHPAEALARSREVGAEIEGKAVKAYDIGDAGVLVSPAEAERVGLKYRDGREGSGSVATWVIDALVKIGAAKPQTMPVTVAEPEPFFESLMADAAKRR